MFNISNDIPRIRASICVVHSTGAEFLGRRVAGTIVEPAPNSQVCLKMCDYSTCSKPSILLTLLLWPQTVFFNWGYGFKIMSHVKDHPISIVVIVHAVLP